MRLSLQTLAEWSGGKLSDGADPQLSVSGASIDTRTLMPGCLFVALKGGSADGHDYIATAAEAGAVAALVEDESKLGGLPGVVVEDCVRALGDIAHNYRWKFKLIPWVAVTGTNGKSTTRHMIAHVIRGRGNVCEPVKNFNNLIGLPLTILRYDDKTDYGVLEMGTSNPGEIARLVEITEPTVSVLTNVSPAHLEGLQSLEGVAREKAEVFGRLPEDGYGVYPAQSDYATLFAEKCQGRGRTFAVEAHAGLVAKNVRLDENGSRFEVAGVEFCLPLLGRHNISNCLAALSALQYFDIPFEECAQRLKTVDAMPERLQVIQAKRVSIIDDSYNANPASLHAAVRTLCALPAKRRVLIVGDMLELGEQSEELHGAIGRWLSQKEVDVVLAVGKSTLALAENSHDMNARQIVRYFRSVQSMMGHLPELIQEGDMILVKGSRGMRLERVVKALQMIDS